MGTFTIFLSVLVMSSFMPDRAMSSTELDILTANHNKFSFDIYQMLKNKSENVNVSPVSIYIILLILYQGAKGDTASEIAKVAHFPANKDMRATSTLELCKEWITQLHSPELKLATRLFLENNVTLNHEFHNVSNEYYLTDVEGKDFKNNSEPSRKEINKWAEENTNGKIKDLLPQDSVDKLTTLVLVNAIYFKDQWLYTFNKNLTQEMPFYITPNKTVNVEMMRLYNQEFLYMESQKLDAKIIKMPYMSDNHSMVVICPNKLDGLEFVENNLINENISELLSGLYMTEVHVLLPKFKIEETMDLINPLENLGMRKAFTDEADLSEITKDISLKVSAIIQKSFIEVDEEGTEAAAATGLITQDKTSISFFDPPPLINCNRPFLYFIMHTSTNTVLFVSRLQKF